MDDDASGLLRHPLVNELIEGGVVHHEPAHLLELTPACAGLLLAAAQAGRRVVLHTSLKARMSPALVQTLGDVQGRWIVEDADGRAWDGLGGHVLDPADPLGSPAQSDDALPPEPTDATEVLLAASLRHRADIAPTYGVALERFALALGATPTVFGPYEPADREWTHAAVAAELAASTKPKRLFVHGDGDRLLRGSLLVRPTDKGMEEVVDVTIAMPAGSDDLAARVHRALEQIAASSFVLAAVALARPGHADLLRRPGRPLTVTPLAVLLGPIAARDLGADASELAERFSIIRIGRPRTPSLLLPLHGKQSDWQLLEEIVEFIGRDRIEAVLGRPLPIRPV